MREAGATRRPACAARRVVGSAGGRGILGVVGRSFINAGAARRSSQFRAPDAGSRALPGPRAFPGNGLDESAAAGVAREFTFRAERRAGASHTGRRAAVDERGNGT